MVVNLVQPGCIWIMVSIVLNLYLRSSISDLCVEIIYTTKSVPVTPKYLTYVGEKEKKLGFIK